MDWISLLSVCIHNSIRIPMLSAIKMSVSVLLLDTEQKHVNYSKIDIEEVLLSVWKLRAEG